MGRLTNIHFNKDKSYYSWHRRSYVWQTRRHTHIYHVTYTCIASRIPILPSLSLPLSLSLSLSLWMLWLPLLACAIQCNTVNNGTIGLIRVYFGCWGRETRLSIAMAGSCLRRCVSQELCFAMPTVNC